MEEEIRKKTGKENDETETEITQEKKKKHGGKPARQKRLKKGEEE